MHSLKEYRESKDRFMGHDPQSPLPAEHREAFTGLEYYPENEDLQFLFDVEPIADREQVHMQTSTGEVQEYLRFGTFSFEVEGQAAIPCKNSGSPSLAGWKREMADQWPLVAVA